jgi:glucose-6-phosphate isomerase
MAQTDTPASQIAEPTAVRIENDGQMRGRDSHYEKRLAELSGVYRDQDAFAVEIARRGGDTLVYKVDENRVGHGDGALILGTSTVLPGRIGEEYAMTRGHIHAKADRAEIYHGVAGRGVMLLETLTGESRALPIEPGVAVHVPGHWVHRSVNTGPDPLVTIFVYNEDAGQDYEVIARAGGMRQLIVDDGAGGWKAVPNPDHIGYRMAGL